MVGAQLQKALTVARVACCHKKMAAISGDHFNSIIVTRNPFLAGLAATYSSKP
jgi:hypothetical protein